MLELKGVPHGFLMALFFSISPYIYIYIYIYGLAINIGNWIQYRVSGFFLPVWTLDRKKKKKGMTTHTHVE